MGKRETFLLVLLSSFLVLFFAVFGQKSPRQNFNLASTILKPFNREVTVFLAGDIMLGRSVLTWADKVKNPNYSFEKVKNSLAKGDIVFANLEAPFFSPCPRTDLGMVFCSDPKMVAGLKESNVKVVSLANNHINNYGQAGVAQTKEILTIAGIDAVGDGNLAVKEIKGVRFGFLGFNFVETKPSLFEYEMVAKAKKTVDVLIVGVHWGNEYQAKANKTQQEIAQNLIEKGADVIAGHHPHWVQNIDYINGKPVYYSLGNFIFDQPWSEETKKGLVMKLIFRDGKLVKEERLPIYMPFLGQPEFVK